MLLKKGIVRKTFLFSAMLILLVVSAAFAILYFLMPGYYLHQRERTLQSNLDILTDGLRAAESEEACAHLIAEFSARNNVDVLSFSKEGALIPAISSPFVSMEGAGDVFFSASKKTEGEGGERVERQTYSVIMIGGPGDSAARPATLSFRLASGDRENTITLNGNVGTPVLDHIQMSGTLQPIDEARGVLLSLIPYVLLVAILIGLVLAGIYARQISKPVLQISEAAVRMRAMEHGVSAGVKTGDELGELSANLDTLYTSLLRNIEQLRAEMDKVGRLERSKTEMMQSASHELKTPIAALNGMVEGMLDNVGSYKNREKYLQECKGQIDKLSHLVAEILDASKTDLADTELALGEVAVDELVLRALAENQYPIDERELRVSRSLPRTTIVTDSDILYRAIFNLIINAAQYTPRGGEIHVGITEEGRRALFVENQCEPIPEGELEKLFEPFYTRSYSRDRAESGTGLGLYIVKRSLERLDISYKAVSKANGLRMELFL